MTATRPGRHSTRPRITIGRRNARGCPGEARPGAGALMAKPETSVGLTWTGDLTFAADLSNGRHIVTDGNSKAGLSPVELLAVATVGCMAVDVVHILGKSRQPPTALEARFT